MTVITKSSFGFLQDGREVSSFLLENDGLSVQVLDFGGTIKSIFCPDRTGKKEDIVLGYDALSDYEANPFYFGCTVGRTAGRTFGGSFDLNGKTYSLAKNCGEHSSHGGLEGFHRKLWQSEILHTAQGKALRLSYVSEDGEEGYPGTLQIHVTYSLIGNRLILFYEAKSDQDTLVNLTNHSYVNLSGKGTILSHLCMIASDEILETDAELIPTGNRLRIWGSPFDFTDFHTIGARIREADTQLLNGHGYDHYYVLRAPDLSRMAAVLVDPISERRMTVYTDQPGLQFYTANTFPTFLGKGNAEYGPFCGVALETQGFPDAVHHEEFPSTLLRAGEKFESTTMFKFDIL